MASDVISLLKASNAWVDPNLMELANTSAEKLKRKKIRDEQQLKQIENSYKGMQKKKEELENGIGSGAGSGAGSGTGTGGEPAKKRRRRGGVKNRAKREKMNPTKPAREKMDFDDDDNDDDDDNEFGFLGNRIVLKRAEHVSDAEDSSDDDH